MSCHCWANVRIQYNCGPTLQSLWANLGYQLTNLRPSLQSWAKVVPMPLWCLGKGYPVLSSLPVSPFTIFIIHNTYSFLFIRVFKFPSKDCLSFFSVLLIFFRF